MIEVRQLAKKFGQIDVLKGLDLNVHKGSIYGLVGSNGAGKTTLLKLLAGIYRPDEGSIKMNGQPVFENNLVKESDDTDTHRASGFHQERIDSLHPVNGIEENWPDADPENHCPF